MKLKLLSPVTETLFSFFMKILQLSIVLLTNDTENTVSVTVTECAFSHDGANYAAENVSQLCTLSSLYQNTHQKLRRTPL